MDKRACRHCGASIMLLRKGAKFCSPGCRAASHYAARIDPIPAVMRDRSRWMRRMPSKRPVTIEGKPGSSTDPSTWCSYDEARQSRVGAGLGFALGDGIGCYDLDDALEDGALKPWAQAILDSVAPIFTEVSQSGRGVHIFVHTTETRGRVERFADHRVEFYPDGRYIAVTGDRLK